MKRETMSIPHWKQKKQIQVKKGDVVMVDDGFLTASPWRGRGAVKCEVLEDSGVSQTYVCPENNTPQYVFNKDILHMCATAKEQE